MKHENGTGFEDFEEQEQNIKYVVESGGWTVKDVAGEQEVVLSKDFGNEKYVVPC